MGILVHLRSLAVIIVLLGLIFCLRYRAKQSPTRTDALINLIKEPILFLAGLVLLLFFISQLYGWYATGRLVDAHPSSPIRKISFDEHPVRFAYLAFVYLCGFFVFGLGVPLVAAKVWRGFIRGNDSPQDKVDPRHNSN